MVCNFFGSVAVLYVEKLVDIKIVVRLLGVSVITTWEKVQHLVEGGRRQLGPHMYEDFEYLYNEIKKREQQLQQSKV